MIFRNGVSWSQSSVYRFLKMWYDDSTAARLDRFSHIALKQNRVCRTYAVSLDLLYLMVRYILLSRFQKDKLTHPSCYICDKMFILVHLLSVAIFDICFQWDSKLKNNLKLYLESKSRFLFEGFLVIMHCTMTEIDKNILLSIKLMH